MQDVSTVSKNLQSAVEQMAVLETSGCGQWMLDASRACYHRRFFVTKRGLFFFFFFFFGLGPCVLEEGDICWVIFGGTVPFILRRKGSCYLLLGEAYVHGIMRGEAIRMWRNDDLQEQNFRLV
jgi:hypothetical protein